MTSRRDFLATAGLTASALALASRQAGASTASPILTRDTEPDPQVKVLLENPPEALREKVLKAARYCPNNVITVLEE